MQDRVLDRERERLLKLAKDCEAGNILPCVKRTNLAGLLTLTTNLGCPRCGSKTITEKKWEAANGSKLSHYQCGAGCGYEYAIYEPNQCY